jgi:hypothetical protein
MGWGGQRESKAAWEWEWERKRKAESEKEDEIEREKEEEKENNGKTWGNFLIGGIRGPIIWHARRVNSWERGS